MTVREEPLVSVVTPVYNGQAFLAECIESVISQTYSNCEYVILNNASTDGTLQIAERYARGDKRIRVFSNETLLDIISNHNRAFSLISPDSKYCKIVSGDDWLFPECLMSMVSLAEANPTVGIVGSYQLSGGGSNWQDWRIRNDALPYPSPVIPGREVCRLQMLGGPVVFGNPTSVLYRSDLIKGQDRFYPNLSAEADTSACYNSLKDTDFGFVHQILSYERVHNVRQTAKSLALNAYISSSISDLIEYGRYYLSPEQVDTRVNKLLQDYYAFLAESSLKFRDKRFWTYHTQRLEELGHPLSRTKLAKAICAKLADLALNPKQTAEQLVRWLNGKVAAKRSEIAPSGPAPGGELQCANDTNK